MKRRPGGIRAELARLPLATLVAFTSGANETAAGAFGLMMGCVGEHEGCIIRTLRSRLSRQFLPLQPAVQINEGPFHFRLQPIIVVFKIHETVGWSTTVGRSTLG